MDLVVRNATKSDIQNVSMNLDIFLNVFITPLNRNFPKEDTIDNAVTLFSMGMTNRDVT